MKIAAIAKVIKDRGSCRLYRVHGSDDLETKFCIGTNSEIYSLEGFPKPWSEAEVKLTIQDMIDIQKSLANELASLAALEATTSFAQEMATKASGKPVEFFKLMPRAKIKQVQTAILLSLNAKTKSDPAKHIVKFDAPYTYNGEEKADIKGKTFESVDLSGVGELNTMSESMAENRLAGYGFTPVNTGHNYAYVCIIASMGTGYPVDYFTGLPLCEAAKLRDAVDADFFE